jgi:WD40 repeat protein
MNNNTNNNMNNNNQIEEWANLNQGSNSRMNENYNNDLDCQYHEVQTLIGHADKIVSLIELESGHIATGSYDCTIRVWDLNQNICVMTKIERGYVFCLLEFEPNMILAGTSENNIDLWDLSSQNNENEFTFMQHTLWVNCLVRCDDDHFASAGNDALICIWDYKNRQLKYDLKGHIDCILTLIKLNNGNLCSGSADLTIKIWDWKNQRLISSIKTPHNKWVKCIYQLNDGTLLSGSENICVWTNQNFTPIKKLCDHKHYIRTLCQIDDNHFASGSFDKTIKIWNIRDFTVAQTIEAHNSNVICIIKLKDNKLVSCSNDKTIKIWERNNYI